MLKKSDYFKQNTIEKLWSFEKSTFRFWVWSYFVFLLVLVLISIVNIVLFYFADFNNIDPSLIDAGTKQLTMSELNNIKNKFLQNVITQVIYNLALLVFYVFGIQNSYDKKNFKHLNQLVVYLVYLTVFINLINFVTLIDDFSIFYKNVNVIGKFPLAIMGLNIFQSVITIIFGIFLGKEISAIRKAFIRIELLKQQEEFLEKMKKDMGINMNNPYGMYDPFMSGFYRNPNSYQNVNDQEVQKNAKEADETEEFEINKPMFTEEKNSNKDDSQREKEIKKLLELPNQKLFKIAEKLNIFGYEDLTKEELAEKIYIYTKSEK
ncbi:hypothetical protein [Mycoplasma anserisalpingitidis]|uniref:hypothetical protein n=1 Tax=Mycoplasma anserisalpingitidis TaxID=519450 RepID=UPI001CF6710F|nr:hypothetical protein [Mycoplasma anserisalpingitidis]UCU26392.1 hypothetical protein K7D06_02145 [Mycoplasma anserisalpingitidis]UCU27231.1 hypothetical protein K9O38_02815 [Mycoplasma anserisalpingitidis]